MRDAERDGGTKAGSGQIVYEVEGRDTAEKTFEEDGLGRQGPRVKLENVRNGIQR